MKLHLLLVLLLLTSISAVKAQNDSLRLSNNVKVFGTVVDIKNDTLRMLVNNDTVPYYIYHTKNLYVSKKNPNRNNLRTIYNAKTSAMNPLRVFPIVNGKITYTNVVNVDATNKDELFNRARRWFVYAFKSAKDVIQFEDKENGEIIGKGYFPFLWSDQLLSIVEAQIYTTIRVNVKDNKVKYELSEFNIHYMAGGYTYRNETFIGYPVDSPLEVWNNIYTRPNNSIKLFWEVNTTVESFLSGFKTAVLATEDKTNW